MIRDASEGSLLKCTVIGITRILPHHKSKNTSHLRKGNGGIAREKYVVFALKCPL
jgi:hypothetical protein